jgi:hypothetical protein
LPNASERDRKINRQRRAEFAAQICTIAPERLNFLDESGVTTSMTRCVLAVAWRLSFLGEELLRLPWF